MYRLIKILSNFICFLNSHLQLTSKIMTMIKIFNTSNPLNWVIVMRVIQHKGDTKHEDPKVNLTSYGQGTKRRYIHQAGIYINIWPIYHWSRFLKICTVFPWGGLIYEPR